MNRLTPIVLAAAVLSTAALMAGGCSPNTVTANEVRHNMTPALDSTARTDGQYYNQQARTFDHTWRQISEDLNWLFLLDEPVHMTEYPIP